MLLGLNITESNVLEKNPNLPLSQSNILNFKQLNINGKKNYTTRPQEFRIPSQFFSSDLSWQFASPLHRRAPSIHCPLAHWNWDSEHTGQLSSSLWSSHSVNPSQRQATGIQSISPVKQVNWWGEHVGGSSNEQGGEEWQKYNSHTNVQTHLSEGHLTINIRKTLFNR